MRNSLIAAALLAAFGASTSALADVTANVGLASEYSYRGVSQSDNNPALSGGVDFAHASGLYLGAWASTISWLEDTNVYSSSKVELDLYGGYKHQLAADTVLDVGVLRYQYPGDRIAGTVSPNTTEVYVAGSYKMVTVKYSHAVTNLFGFADSEDSTYLEANASFPIADLFNLDLHVGKQSVENNEAFEYTDYKVAATKDFGIFTGSLAYVGTTGNLYDAAKDTAGEDLVKGRVVVSLTKSF